MVGSITSRIRIEFIGRIIATGSSSLLLVFLARTLSPDEYGTLFLTISLLTFSEIFARAGIGKSAARYLSEFRGEAISLEADIIKVSLLFTLSTTGIMCLLLYLLRFRISMWFGEPYLADLILIGVPYVIFSTLLKYSRSVLQGYESISNAAKINVTNKVLRLLSVISLVLFGYEALGALFGYVIGFFISSITGIYYILKIASFGIISEHQPKEDISKKILKYALPISITSTGYALDKKVDTIIIGYLLNPAAVSFYTLGKQIVTFLELPAQALGFTISPLYSSEDSELPPSKIYEEAIVNSIYIYVPISSGLLIISEPTVLLLFGQEYLPAADILKVFSFYIIAQSLLHITGDGLDFLGRAKARSLSRVGTAFLNVGLNFVLVPYFGVIGASFATVFTTYIYACINISIMLSEIDINKIKTIKRIAIAFFPSIIMSIATVYLVDFANSIGMLLVVILISSGIWTIISLQIGMISSEEIKRLAEI
ncbi:flippase [Natrinema sp. 1APR25-10V2]|uniref:flippase n=1 Tax=Natrinema sp. 1APR25-10V2 TaxID=2951081 RepID=UPI0028748B3E|nr:flippase [Natrinema sp. 1APR25-10V2]MDS0475691.1 flippase [Natrinema sp. 1APR25-10V2]